MIEVKKSWSASFSVNKEHAPDWAVGEVVWLEEKEPTSLRPNSRMRWRVKSREEHDDCVAFAFEQP